MRCYSIVPPCGCRLISQAGPPLGHFFQIVWTDSESRPRPPDVRIEIQDRSRRHTSPLGHTPIDAWIQKMDVDGDGGRRDLRMEDKPHQLRRLSIRWSSFSNDMPRDGFVSNSASRRRASATPSFSSCRTDAYIGHSNTIASGVDRWRWRFNRTRPL